MAKKQNKTGDLSKKTKKELMEMAKKQSIPIKTSFLKDKLIELIKNALPKQIHRKSEVILPARQGRSSSSKVDKEETKKAIKPASQLVRRSSFVVRRSSKELKQEADPRNTGYEIPETDFEPSSVSQQSTNNEIRPASFELPRGYGNDKIVIMVRDPFWLFAYWEVTAKKIDEIKTRLHERFNGAKLILRVYDVTDINFNEKNAWKTVDIEITGGADNWYINLTEANRSYIVDVGFLTADGEFVLCARSNCVTTPRDGAANVVDEEWLTEEYEKVYALSGGFGIGKSSEELGEMMKKRRLELMFSGASEGLGIKK
jgi:hypothetical protein